MLCIDRRELSVAPGLETAPCCQLPTDAVGHTHAADLLVLSLLGMRLPLVESPAMTSADSAKEKLVNSYLIARLYW